MNSNPSRTRNSPSDLYWKAYLWAWSNLREPKFSPVEVEDFNLRTIWAWIAFFTGLGSGLAVSYWVLLPYQFRVSRFILFLLTMGIFLVVGPAMEAVVVWSASLLKASNTSKPDGV